MIKQNFKKFFLSFVLITTVVVFCAQRLFFFSTGFLELFFSRITYPIVFFQGKVSNFLENRFKKKETLVNLLSQLDAIKKENEQILFENVRLKSSMGYLEQVGELVEFQKRFNENQNFIAQIIMKQISDEGHLFFIDKGKSAGVLQDMIAVYKNCLIGRVIDVYQSYSKVAYITDKSCKVAAYCFETGAIGIYEGINKLDFATLKYVNHLDELKKDDLVLSSGEGQIFPQGFALGRIHDFVKNEIQYSVRVKPIFDIQSIKYCQLIKK